MRKCIAKTYNKESKRWEDSECFFHQFGTEGTSEEMGVYSVAIVEDMLGKIHTIDPGTITFLTPFQEDKRD